MSFSSRRVQQGGPPGTNLVPRRQGTARECPAEPASLHRRLRTGDSRRIGTIPHWVYCARRAHRTRLFEKKLGRPRGETGRMSACRSEKAGSPLWRVVFMHRAARPARLTRLCLLRWQLGAGVGCAFMRAARPGPRPLGSGGRDPSFAEFIRRIRAGDEQAAADLVRRYEPAIRRAVRVRLRDPRLRRAGRISRHLPVGVRLVLRAVRRSASTSCESPDRLVRLLAAIARNKVAYHANMEHAACRDQRRIDPGPSSGSVRPPEPAPAGSSRLERSSRKHGGG